MEPEVRTRPQRKRELPILRELFETDEEQEENEENEEVEQDSESEEVVPKRRKRSSDNSRPKKRAKGAAPPGLPLAAPRGRGGGRKRKKPGAAATPCVSLFETVKNRGETVQDAARDWLVRYEANKAAGLAELLTMLFKACGSRYLLEEEAVMRDIDVDEVVETMVAQAKNGNVEDSMGSKKGDVRDFKSNLVSFWDALVLECQEVALFDQYLMEKVMDYVIAISCTPPRSFRRVATLVGLQLVSSFVTLANTLGSSRETTQRQLNAERKKNKNGARAVALARSLSETHKKITQVEEMMRKIHTGLFMHRYRDVDENIRIACITSIGSWIASYPSLFLQELYLKYLGFPLNDKKPNVRSSSILALQELYAVEAYVPSLALFTTRFCNRMVELADDIDVSVAVNAIGLLRQLFKHQLLPDELLASLFDFLIDDHAEIRHAVGDLVYEHLVVQNSGSDSKGQANPQEAELERILQILREFSGDPILCDYVIDAFWDKSKTLKDWKCLVSLLLDEEKPKIDLADGDDTNLLRVLLASAKKSVGEKIVPSADARTTDHRKTALSRAQKEALEAAKTEMTLALLNAYPKLLRKFLVDRGKVAAIAEILLYMDLELFSLQRKDQEYKAALQFLKDAFLKHGDEETLKVCAKALSFALSESHADLQDTAQHIVSETVDDLTAKLRRAIKEAGETEDEYSLIANLRRLHKLLLVFPVSNDSLFTEMLGLIKDFNYLDDEVIQLVLLNMFLQLAWSLKSIDAHRPDQATIQALIAKRTGLLDQLQYFADSVNDSWENGTSRSLLSCTICVILSDVWSLFLEEKLAGTTLGELGMKPDKEFLRQFWNLCQHKLFAADNAEDDTEEHSDFFDEKVMVVSAAAKLIANRVIPKDSLGPEVVSHLVLHDRIVMKTVKQLVVGMKEQDNSEDLSYLLLESMKTAHRRLTQDSDDSWPKKDTFNTCKELALQLAEPFGKRSGKSTILKIVKGGIRYAFADAPKHLSFLEVGVIQFADKLAIPDLRLIHDDVVARMRGIDTDEDPSGWRPCLVFLSYLKDKCAIPERSRKKGASVKGSKLLFGTSDEESAEAIENASSGSGEDDDEEEEQVPVPRPRSLRQRSSRAKISKDIGRALTPPTSEAEEQTTVADSNRESEKSDNPQVEKGNKDSPQPADAESNGLQQSQQAAQKETGTEELHLRQQKQPSEEVPERTSSQD